MKAETQKKFIALVVIFAIGIIASIAIAKLTGGNAYLKHLIIVTLAALTGHVISAKTTDSLWPKGLKIWIGFIAAVLLVSTLFWALECFIF